MPSLVRLQRYFWGLLFGLIALTLVLGSASAADCEFALGFKSLQDLIGLEIVGECLENEQYDENGDSSQRTTGGHFFWDKAENITSFTDGHHTWIYGRFGLQYRLNTERFPWESDYEAPVDDSTASPQPSAIPAPSDASPTPSVVPLPPPVTPEEDVLPLPPAPWVSINTWIINEYFYASSNRPYWSIDANVVWPDSVTKIEYVFEGGGGKFTSTEGRSFTKSTVVCLPSDGGTTKSFQLVARAFGDGVTYRSDYGPWSSSAGMAVVCESAINLPAFPYPTPIPQPTPSRLPYPPAPLVSLSARIIDANYQAWSNLGVISVEANVLWPDSVTKVRYLFIEGKSGAWSTSTAGRDFTDSLAVCLPSEAGTTKSFRLQASAAGDGETYRADYGAWSSNHTLPVVCPGPPDDTTTPTLTPTPNPNLPLPPVISGSVSSQLIEKAYYAWDGRPTMLVTFAFSWPSGVSQVRSQGDHVSSWSAGQLPSYVIGFCEPRHAGQPRSPNFQLQTFGDGVKYRAEWSAWGPSATAQFNCPNAPILTPTPTPTPTPVPGALPNPPKIVASIDYSIIAANHKAWSTLPTVRLSWSYSWPAGISEIRTTGIGGVVHWLAGQSPTTSIEVCLPSEAGQTKRFGISVDAFGDGEKYQAVWTGWSTIARVTVVCPQDPSQPILTAPPAPSLSLSSSSRDVDYDDFGITVVVSVTYDNGVKSIQYSGNLLSSSWSRQSSTGSQTSTNSVPVCSPSQGSQSLSFSVTASAIGDAVVYLPESGAGTTRSISVTCPERTTPKITPAATSTPTPTPTVAPGTPPTPTLTPGLTPTPTPTPSAGTLRLPPAPSLSLSSRARNSDTSDYSIVIVASSSFDHGVRAIHFSGNLFGAGHRRWRQSTTGSQGTNVHEFTCSPAQGGRTLSFTVTARAQGDGVVYRSANGPGTTSTISVSCPVSATPTPTPTPEPGVG